MENAGFMMNHYWNVSGLTSIRLGNARFAPGDPGRRHNEVTVFLWENLFTPFLLQWFLSQGYWTFWCRWTIKARKASLFPVLWQLQCWLRSWEKLQVLKTRCLRLFQIPRYKSQSQTLHSSIAVEIYNICFLVHIILGYIYIYIHTHTYIHIYNIGDARFFINTPSTVNIGSSWVVLDNLAQRIKITC